VPEGDIKITFYVNDSAGNVYSDFVIVTKDVVAPLAPSDLIADPISWTNNDDFTLFWFNPSDLSGIVAAYYKLDFQPTSNDDGIYNTGADIELITGIQVGSEGNHSVYVWLVDAAGNVNYLNYAITYLCLDNSIPVISDYQDGDDTWRNIGGTTYDVDFSDSSSGTNLSYAQYIITSEPNQMGTILKEWTYIFNNLGQYSYTTNWLIDFSACREGINYISVRVYDEVGNFQILNNTFYVKKDTEDPVLVFNIPLNNTCWKSRPKINITVFDHTFAFLVYTVIGYSPSSIPLYNHSEALLHDGIWNQLPESPQYFQIEFVCFDNFGQNTTLLLTLYKDLTKPQINIISPEPNELFGNIAPNFNISINEPNLNATWYTLIGLLIPKNFSFTNWTGIIDQLAWQEFYNGTVTIRFYANDTVGHLEFVDITVRKYTISPVINIISPDNDKLIGTDAPSFTISIIGSEIEATWYTLDNGLTIYIFEGLDGIINQTEWDKYGYGSITIKFFINNSVGKIGYDIIVLRKDPDAPSIIINKPLDQKFFASAPFINISIIEPNLNSVWYRVAGEIIYITDNLTQFLDSSIWNNLPEGTFTLELFADDILGNLNNSIQLSLIKDTIGPNITIILPEENQKVDRNAPFFELELYDICGICISWYTIVGENTTIEFTGMIGRIDDEIWEHYWDNMTIGDTITIRFYSMDNLGNINYKDITVIKYQPKKQLKILTNPTGFIFSTLGIGLLIPTTLKLKRSRYYQNLNKKEKGKLKKVLLAAGVLLSITTLFYIF
ncbi:MAG: hypothetical protein ACFE9Y_06875, partial [Promethearchaeota archaeon]